VKKTELVKNKVLCSLPFKKQSQEEVLALPSNTHTHTHTLTFSQLGAFGEQRKDHRGPFLADPFLEGAFLAFLEGAFLAFLAGAFLACLAAAFPAGAFFAFAEEECSQDPQRAGMCTVPECIEEEG